MLSDTRILLEQAINRLHQAENNELEDQAKREIQSIIYKIQNLLDSNR